MGRRMLGLAAALVWCLAGMAGCAEPQGDPRVLGDLAFAEGLPEARFTVLLSEGEQTVPYLVLAEDYMGSGCALLLRKNLLPQPHIFNPNENYGAFYEDSAVDRMLNETFASTLGVTPQAVPIEITDYDSLHGQGQSVTTVTRRVFLLSAMEAGCGSGRTFLAEGKALPYFDGEARRVAYTQEGEAVAWWLRTPCAWYDNVVCCVNTEGVMVFCGLGDITGPGDAQFAVRPAMCLPADTPVVQNQAGEYELKEDFAG